MQAAKPTAVLQATETAQQPAAEQPKRLERARAIMHGSKYRQLFVSQHNQLALPFELIDRISIPSHFVSINEDVVGATDWAAWVIDGATGVSDLPSLVSGLTDAAWLVAQLNDKLLPSDGGPEPHLPAAGRDRAPALAPERFRTSAVAPCGRTNSR